MMTRGPLSLILLPTLLCDADCEFCIEKKTDGQLTHDELSVVVRKVVDHMVREHIETLSVYRQGGEVMTPAPEWFEEAHGIIGEAVNSGRRRVEHFVQSNLIAYSDRRDWVLAQMFGNSVGTSMDYPGLHRKLKRGVRRNTTEYGRGMFERQEMPASKSG